MKYIVSQELARMVIGASTVVLVYFFSYQFQTKISKIIGFINKKFGTYSTTKEHALQKYVYQHKSSVISKLYKWINQQLIALGMKTQGVTPLGYFIFWGFASLLLSVVLGFVLGTNFMFVGLLWFVLWGCMLIMTRVIVSEKIEKREMEVMDAIDLLVPELHNGVKNAIFTYKDNVPQGIRDDFRAFVVNIQDRGFSFADAMYSLADGLGEVFLDFAEKSIYYESMGEKDLLDVFTDIVETNRLRRQLRERNNRRFRELKVTFVVSSLMTFGYFLFLVSTDVFSRQFLLQSMAGNIILLIICIIIFGVMAFITTIKSRSI